MAASPSKRRIGSPTSAVREAILNAAAQVLKEEGAANLTASSVAKRAGVKAHMVHYYFRTIDDLVLALVRQHGALGLKNTAHAIASDEPLRSLWDSEITYKWGIVAMEFGTLAVHRESIRLEMSRYIEDLRNLQAEGIARHFQLRGIECPIPPIVLTVIIAGIARQIVREKEFGVSLGHEDTFLIVDQFLAELSRPR